MFAIIFACFTFGVMHHHLWPCMFGICPALTNTIISSYATLTNAIISSHACIYICLLHVWSHAPFHVCLHLLFAFFLFVNVRVMHLHVYTIIFSTHHMLTQKLGVKRMNLDLFNSFHYSSSFSLNSKF